MTKTSDNISSGRRQSAQWWWVVYAGVVWSGSWGTQV